MPRVLFTLFLASCSFEGSAVETGERPDASVAVDAADSDGSSDGGDGGTAAACQSNVAYSADPSSGIGYRLGPPGLTWPQARDVCAGEGAHLVTIETGLEDAYLWPLSDGVMWIGANDLTIEGEWVWLTGGTVESYNNWNPGNPDDGLGGEDCGLIRVTDNWNDAECARTDPAYICECPN